MTKSTTDLYWHFKISKLDFKAIAIVAWIVACVVCATLWPVKFFGLLFMTAGIRGIVICKHYLDFPIGVLLMTLGAFILTF